MKDGPPRIWRHLFGGDPAEFPICPVDEQSPTLCVGHPDPDRATVRHDAEALFALAQRLLGSLALGNVLHVDHKIKRAAAGVPHQRDLAARPHHGAVAIEVAFLDFRAFFRVLAQPLDDAQGSLHVVGVRQFHPGSAGQFRLAISEHPAERRIRLHDSPVHGDHVHADRRPLENLAKSLLALPKFPLGPQTLANVARNGRGAHYFSRGIPDRGDGERDVDGASVLP